MDPVGERGKDAVDAYTQQRRSEPVSALSGVPGWLGIVLCGHIGGAALVRREETDDSPWPQEG
jgi:hypothetical protein